MVSTGVAAPVGGAPARLGWVEAHGLARPHLPNASRDVNGSSPRLLCANATMATRDDNPVVRHALRLVLAVVHALYVLLAWLSALRVPLVRRVRRAQWARAPPRCPEHIWLLLRGSPRLPSQFSPQPSAGPAACSQQAGSPPDMHALARLSARLARAGARVVSVCDEDGRLDERCAAELARLVAAQLATAEAATDVAADPAPDRTHTQPAPGPPPCCVTVTAWSDARTAGTPICVSRLAVRSAPDLRPGPPAPGLSPAPCWSGAPAGGAVRRNGGRMSRSDGTDSRHRASSGDGGSFGDSPADARGDGGGGGKGAGARAGGKGRAAGAAAAAGEAGEERLTAPEARAAAEQAEEGSGGEAPAGSAGAALAGGELRLLLLSARSGKADVTTAVRALCLAEGSEPSEQPPGKASADASDNASEKASDAVAAAATARSTSRPHTGLALADLEGRLSPALRSAGAPSLLLSFPPECAARSLLPQPLLALRGLHPFYMALTEFHVMPSPLSRASAAELGEALERFAAVTQRHGA